MAVEQRSPTIWHQGLVSWKTIFPRTGLAGEDGSGGNASDGERWGEADEASLARLPLTSCCVARCVTGRGPLLVRGPGIEDPCYRVSRMETDP